MGLIQNLLISMIHLIFVMMDIILAMILIQVIYNHWKFVWLKPFADIVEPAIKSINSSINAWVLKITGKSHTDKIFLIVSIFLLSVIRFIICSLV